ncbi:hypothetical protein LJC31_04035 [Synergistaceae bacterium OttesenSCG-928-I11]|nr:hypothetical protein [Synergistaceae bacterium OttesenSCG-928-I11]
MNKKMLVVLAVLIAVAAGVFAMRDSGAPVAPKWEKLGAEAALPKFANDKNHVLLKVENVEGLRKGIRILKDFMPLMSDPDVMDEVRSRYEDMKELGGVNPMDSLEKLDLAMKYVTLFDAFFTAADEIAFLGAAPDICLTFFTNEEKFAAMKTTLEGARNAAEAWSTELAGEGGEAWIVRETFPSFDEEKDDTTVALHVLKRADGERTQVLVAGSEETMQRAVRAWENPSDRAAVARKLDGPNFLQYRFTVPVYGSDTSRDMASEMAWRTEGNTTKFDSFSDLAAFGITPATSGVEGEALPLYGSGEPFALAAFDLPYFFSIAMPGADNPVESFVALMEASIGQRIPLQFRSDALAVLSGSRATVGVFMNPDEIVPSTAYLALEMKSPDVLGKYFALAGMLMKPAQIEGWESALSENVDDGIDVTLARSGNRMLLGIGKPEEYAKQAALPAAMSGMPDKGILVATYVAMKFITDENTALGRMIRDVVEEHEDGPEIAEVFDKLSLRSFESISGVQVDPERAESRIVWSEKQ